VPSLTVLAGPNGSGKSSTTRYFQFEGRENLLDPDAIARRSDPEDPSRAAVKAGREVIRRIREYLDGERSFGIETTLSGSGHL
jgi:predicted ABC-type ATPase